MCVICRTRRPKHMLTRHVLTPGIGTGNGEALTADPRQRMPGRGWYLCGDERCTKAFGRYRVRQKKKGGS